SAGTTHRPCHNHRGAGAQQVPDCAAVLQVIHGPVIPVEADSQQPRWQETVLGQDHEDHVGGLLGDVRAGDAHGNADVSLLQRRGVVHAVAGHGHDGSLQKMQSAREEDALPPSCSSAALPRRPAHLPLAALHDDQLLL
ncbi:hypothetical protein MC885_006632, partial [Smutsia gigantea]